MNEINYKQPEYAIWLQMRQRCNNPKCRVYKYYGGRGIKVCESWDSFSKFLEDMGKRPDGDFSIDRINVDGDYEPANCRWANRTTQITNRRCYNKLGYAGLRKKGNTYQARITVDYKEIYIGAFRTIEDAIKARKEAEKKYART